MIRCPHCQTVTEELDSLAGGHSKQVAIHYMAWFCHECDYAVGVHYVMDDLLRENQLRLSVMRGEAKRGSDES